jgi:hypothetical protein
MRVFVPTCRAWSRNRRLDCRLVRVRMIDNDKEIYIRIRPPFAGRDEFKFSGIRQQSNSL